MTVVDARKLSRVHLKGETEIWALDNVSLTVKRGEFVSLVGRSGSGKSTLLNLLGLLDLPTTGDYLFEDRDIAGMDDVELSAIRNLRLGFVFQSFHLIPHLSILENVGVPLFYQGLTTLERHRLAADALGRVGLARRLHHLPAELSGGECQRAAIARAIVHDPALILADEPTGNLDRKTGSTILNLFHELNNEGRTLIIATHDPGIAERTSRKVTLEDGRIVTH